MSYGNDWYPESIAGRVIQRAKEKNPPRPDGRFRKGTLSGQIQEVYFSVLSSTGISLKKKDLIGIWESHFKSEYELYVLEKRHRELLDLRRNISRRIKENLKRIDQILDRD